MERCEQAQRQRAANGRPQHPLGKPKYPRVYNDRSLLLLVSEKEKRKLELGG